VYGDPTRLAQVVANLLHNAAKYTPRGGRVTVSVAQREGQVEVVVADTGIGIPPAELPHVFEMFAQLAPGSGSSNGGLGIGLTLARRLIELHRGTIEARSEGAGKGATFVVRLPLLPASQQAQPAPVDAPPVPARRRILVVDDNVDAAEVLAEVLEELGHHVAMAHDGPSALATATTFAPDIAVLDIGLPVMDGYELAQRIADHPHPARIRLIAVTGYGQDHDRARSLAAGFHAHLVKPVDLDHLRSTIDTLRRET